MSLLWKMLFILVLVTLPAFLFIVLYAVVLAVFEHVKKARIKKTIEVKTKIKEKVEKTKADDSFRKKNKEWCKKLKEWYKKLKEWCSGFIIMNTSMIVITFFLSIMLGLPLVIQNNCMDIGTDLKKIIKIGTTRDWFKFWSSYVGSIMSIAFAYFNTKLQLKRKTNTKDIPIISELNKSTKKYFYDTMLDDLYDISDSIRDAKNDNISINIEKYWEHFNKYDDLFQDTIKKTSYSTEKKLYNIMGAYKYDTTIFAGYLRDLRIIDKRNSPSEREQTSNLLKACDKEISQTILIFGAFSGKIENFYNVLRMKS